MGKEPSHSSFLKIAGVVLAIRLIFLGWAFVAQPAEQAKGETVLQIWKRWDGKHYLEIAERGYEGKGLPDDRREFNSRFPPLYPWMIRCTSFISRLPDYLAGELVSVISLVLASWLLFQLVQFEWGSQRNAWWAVVFLNLHPGSYFAHAVYSESLFLFLSCLYLFTVRTKNNPSLESFSLSGLLLTRQVGLAFLPLHALRTGRRLLELRSVEQRRISEILKELGRGVLPLVCFGSFLLWQKYLELPGYSGKNVPFRVILPFEETLKALSRFWNWQEAWSDDFFLYTLGYSHLMLSFTAAVVFFGIRTVPWSYSIVGVSYIVILAVMNWNIASIRYTFALITTPMILCRIKPEWLRFVLIAISTSLLGYFSWVFINKYHLI